MKLLDEKEWDRLGDFHYGYGMWLFSKDKWRFKMGFHLPTWFYILLGIYIGGLLASSKVRYLSLCFLDLVLGTKGKQESKESDEDYGEDIEESPVKTAEYIIPKVKQSTIIQPSSAKSQKDLPHFDEDEIAELLRQNPELSIKR